MPDIRIGISGWRYVPWRKTFYPKGLPQKDELHYASRCLNSIEINGSFYSLQTPASYRKWYEQTPKDFVFSVKGARYITHMKRLRNIDEPLANFFASGVLLLKEKLGPILWQFPPNLKYDPEKFEAFFEKLPRNNSQAARLARQHGNWLKKERVWTRTDRVRPIRHAIEIRHESFKTPEFVKLLRKHQIALVFADTAGKWPYFEDVTANFIYARLHGDEKIYASGYTDTALDFWAKRMKLWTSGRQPKDAKLVLLESPPQRRSARDAFIYFDNDVKVRAPADAMGLAERLGLGAPPCQVHLPGTSA